MRGIFQYLDLQRDLALYDPAVRAFFGAKTQTLFTQLLFSYKLNPQTVLFLGTSDNRLGTESLDLSQTDRSFFFKAGHAPEPQPAAAPGARRTRRSCRSLSPARSWLRAAPWSPP